MLLHDNEMIPPNFGSQIEVDNIKKYPVFKETNIEQYYNKIFDVIMISNILSEIIF